MGILGDIKSLINDTNKPAPAAPVVTGPKKVLIVEDEKMLADAITAQLNHDGYDVFRAENGEQGLQSLQTQKPDVVLLDLLMPVMDGKTMLQKMREIPEFKTLPVIVLTNSGNIENMEETQTFYNVKSFLVKSNISLDEIVRKIKEALNQPTETTLT